MKLDTTGKFALAALVYIIIIFTLAYLDVSPWIIGYIVSGTIYAIMLGGGGYVLIGQHDKQRTLLCQLNVTGTPMSWLELLEPFAGTFLPLFCWAMALSRLEERNLIEMSGVRGSENNPIYRITERGRKLLSIPAIA